MNVLKTIYPISEEQRDIFVKQLKLNGIPDGNIREIQALKDQKPSCLVNEDDYEDEDVYYNINVNVYDQEVGCEKK